LKIGIVSPSDAKSRTFTVICHGEKETNNETRPFHIGSVCIIDSCCLSIFRRVCNDAARCDDPAVVGLFPSAESVPRLVSAVLMETDERWLIGKRYLNMNVERND
jgi:hypothetical protein